MFPRFSDKAIHKINKNFIVTDKDILEVLRYNGKELPFDAERGFFTCRCPWMIRTGAGGDHIGHEGV